MITTSAHGLGFKVECLGFMTGLEKETCEREAADHLAGLDEAHAQELHFVLKRGLKFHAHEQAWAVTGELNELGRRLLTNERWRSVQGWFKLGHVA